MTVEELIEELKKYPEDYEVVLEEALALRRKILNVDKDETYRPYLVILS